MGGHERGAAFALHELHELGEHTVRRCLIEIAGGFIGQHQRGLVGQRAGYRDALREVGIEPSSKAVHFGDPSDAAVVRRVLATGQAAAIVCGNDVTAAKLLHTLDELGVVVPDDVRVAGFDDVRYANLLRVPLTTIHQPCRDLGTAAVQAMVERLANPALPARDILLDARLVVRRSTTVRRAKPAAPKR